MGRLLAAQGFRRSNRGKPLCHNGSMTYESHDDHLDDAGADEFLDGGEEDEDESFDAAVIICPECGHANLEFRTRCRRCRGTMASPSNLTLGGHLLDHTTGAHEGRPAHGELSGADVNSRVLSVLLFVLFLFAFPIIIQGLDLSPAAATMVLFLFLAGLWKLQTAVERRKRHKGNPETGQRPMPGVEEEAEGEEAPPEPPKRCPTCDTAVLYIDDICPECGEIVAPDLEPE